MRFAFAAATLAPVLALPITRANDCDGPHAVNITLYNTQSQDIQFHFLLRADEALVLDLGIPQCNDEVTECNALIVSGHTVPVDLALGHTVFASRKTSVTIDVADASGQLRSAILDIDASLTKYSGTLDSEIEAVITAKEIDGQALEGHKVVVRWAKPRGHPLTVGSLHHMLPAAASAEYAISCPVAGLPVMDDHATEVYIAQELEQLRLLEEKAMHLQQEILVRRRTMDIVVADHRTQRPLQDLIQECDGVVCAAKQIATRVYDHINLATIDRTRMQAPIAGADGRVGYVKIASASESRPVTTLSVSDMGTSNGYIVKALSIIASLLGLAGLFLLIKKKCMSMRTRVERAADREERRNARAYRRAARRAEMRQRWSDFVQSLNCFAPKEKPRMTDYDEKRALILQDALLEQDFSQLEKGDIMEAEIRQLRNAQEIVANIILSREEKPTNMRKDPPPSIVPLPISPARSRASTGTLPSYNSEDLPDYSSIPEPTNENVTTDGFAYYQPTSFAQDTSYVARAPLSNISGQTRSTPISSLPALSPRVSAETLRTRFSRGDSLSSRD